MNCYECKHRGKVPGSAHSSCNVITSVVSPEELYTAKRLEFGIALGSISINIVKLNPVGVRGGWAMWPINFAPVWVEECKAFTNKNNEEITK